MRHRRGSNCDHTRPLTEGSYLNFAQRLLLAKTVGLQLDKMHFRDCECHFLCDLDCSYLDAYNFIQNAGGEDGPFMSYP